MAIKWGSHPPPGAKAPTWPDRKRTRHGARRGDAQGTLPTPPQIDALRRGATWTPSVPPPREARADARDRQAHSAEASVGIAITRWTPAPFCAGHRRTVKESIARKTRVTENEVGPPGPVLPPEPERSPVTQRACREYAARRPLLTRPNTCAHRSLTQRHFRQILKRIERLVGRPT